MNSCCNLPEETIANNQHQSNNSRCLVTEQTTAPTVAICPVSKTSSRRVQHRTVEHMVTPENVSTLLPLQYYYCADPKCSVVYFANDSAPHLSVNDIRLKIFTKDTGEDVNVCYCFDWTRGRIQNDIQQTGASTASMQIVKEVKAGTCECDIKNPKGECCLGDINAEVKKVLQLLTP